MKSIYEEPRLTLVQACEEDILSDSDNLPEGDDENDPSITLPKVDL